MRRVVFLDVDGVLNRIGYGGNVLFEEELVEDFCACVKTAGAEVVVHSSWREVPSKFSELCDVLANRGVVVRDRTESGMNKAESVIRYVRCHGVLDYVVVDDDDYTRDFPGRSVRTVGRGWVGFTPDVALSVLGILGRNG